MRFSLESGVKSSPYGSLLRKEYEINDGNASEVYSPRGLQAQREIMQNNRQHGATFGEAHTFGLGLRVKSNEEYQWEYNGGNRLYLSPQQVSYVQAAVQVAKDFNASSRPWVATVALKRPQFFSNLLIWDKFYFKPLKQKNVTG